MMRPLRPLPAIAAVFALVFGLALASAAAVAQESPISPFAGVYVGAADVYDGDGTLVGQRDLEIIIEELGRNRFRITWTNVSLVDGRRDVPGVERRVGVATFEPGDQPNVYVQETRGSLFEREEDIDFLEGDALRWASIEGDRMGMYSIALTEEGLLEVQSYVRTLTDIGMDLDFRRMYDGRIDRRIEGTAVRTE
jgi:hypothetical protein